MKWAKKEKNNVIQSKAKNLEYTMFISSRFFLPSVV